jgi:alkaline phosphatase D
MSDPRETLAALQDHVIDRRRFLAFTGALAGTALYAQVRGEAAPARPLRGYPFRLGIASGDPEPTAVSLWTRLAPEPLVEGGGMPRRDVAVRWELARDHRFKRVERRGVVAAVPELAHSVHVDVRGLDPGREYFYRFSTGPDRSPVGRTVTAPKPGAKVKELTFAFASCQAWPDGFYSAYRRMNEQDLDLVIHLGDYIYEYGIPADGGARNVAIPPALQEYCVTLERFRLQHSLHKTDPDLQESHRRFPWAVTWDDHEVENDYAGIYPEYAETSPEFLAKRAAAYQAYFEHMPLRLSARPSSGDLKLYRRLRYGDLAEFNVLDTRQYRADQPCGDGEQPRCQAGFDPAATMTGDAQEEWLLDGLQRSRAKWNVIAQGVMMGELKHDAAGGRFWQDAWDGYPGQRARLLESIAGISEGRAQHLNPVVVTGDWHSTFVNDLKVDFEDASRDATVATEFVGTSITTNGDGLVYGPYYEPMVPFNPSIQFFDGDRRGYVLCKLDHDQWRTELRMVEEVGDADAAEYTYAAFVVEDGRPGAEIDCSPGPNPPKLGRVDCAPV